MPWQALVADVGGELDPVTGLPAYREVRVTVPRQSGKTTLFLAWQINRCVSRRWSHPQRSAFTAQTGKDARDKWIDELFPLIRSSRLKSLVAVKGSRLEINEGMGNESIRFKTGSLIRLLSTATTSGHSKTLHQAVMDEVWHDIDDRREQGLRPAMITVDDAQLLVCSTAGTDASLVLNRKVDTGRAAALADTGSGVAYFEWSAPDGWDPTDEASYVTFMPALCPAPPCRCAGPGESWHHTITSLDAIRSERDEMKTDNYAEFRRAYGNRKTSATDRDRWSVLSELDWLALLDPTTTAIDPLCFAIDTTPERSHSSIAVVGPRADGDVHGELTDHAPGTSWVVGRAVELHARWHPARWVVDAGGAAGFLIPELTRLGLPVESMGARAVGQAYAMLRSAAASEERQAAPAPTTDMAADTQPVRVAKLRVRVNRHTPALAAAVEGATTRRVGDGTSWDRRSNSVVISPVVALTNALWGWLTLPAPEPVSAGFAAWR